MGRSGYLPQPGHVGPRTRVFALGVMLTIVLTGLASTVLTERTGEPNLSSKTPAQKEGPLSETVAEPTGDHDPDEIVTGQVDPMAEPGDSKSSLAGARTQRDPGRSGEALWGFYIYMAADNSLWEEAQWDLNEMKRIGSRPGLLEIVTLTDYQERSGYRNKADIRNGTTRAYHVLPGELEQTPLSQINSTWEKEVDMGKGESLSDFLIWATDTYPAQNKVLVIWDHGKGWKKVAEDAGGSYLTMPEIGEALVRAGTDFTMIGFDACLMAQTEIVHTLSPHTELVIGSQAYEPALGWTYDTMLGSLLPDLEQLNSEEVAQRLIHNYVESYRNGSKSSDYSVTYSAVAVQGLAQLEAAVEEMAGHLRNISRIYRSILWDIRDSTQTFQDDDYLDLYHFSQLVAQRIPIPQVKASALQVLTAIEAAVVAEDHWFMPNRRDVTNTHGLSIYFPDNSIRGDYFDLSFTHGAMWPEFLDEVFRSQANSGELEATRVTTRDLDVNGYPETLEWEADYTLDTPGGKLLVQLLDGHMGLVSSKTIELNSDRDNLTGDPITVPFTGDYHLQFLLYDDLGYLAYVVNQGPYALDLRLPDLALTQLGLRYLDQEVEGLLEGDMVSISVQVANLGSVTSPACWLNLTVEGLEQMSLILDPLEPGSAVVRNVAWNPTSSGSFTLEGRVEGEDLDEEANPVDNVKVQVVEVHPSSPSPFAPEVLLSLQQAPVLLPDSSGFSPAQVQVTLTNPATNPFDLVELEQVTPAGWNLTLPDSPTFVKGGGSIQFNLSLEVPLRTLAGDHEVQLTAIARDGSPGSTGSLMIPVPAYSGAGLSALLDRAFMEAGGTGQVQITLTNHGNQPATFILQKVLPPAITGWLPDALVQLGPFENTTTVLNLEVLEDLASGDYRLKLSISKPVDQQEIVSLNLTLPVGKGGSGTDDGWLTAPSMFMTAMVVLGMVMIGRSLPRRGSR